MLNAASSVSRTIMGRVPAILITVLLSALYSSAGLQEKDMHQMPEMEMGASDARHATAGDENPIDAAKSLADKQESEFNHRLAGFFVLLAGTFVLLRARFVFSWRFARYAFPLCFFLAGLFVLVFSDTEIWPWGPQSVYYAMTHDPEAAQHKVFAVLLLILGLVEVQRLRGRWTAPWSAWVFPVLAMAGSVLLLVHHHAGDMSGADAMAAMERIEWQHRWYATLGFGIVVAKGLSEANTKWRCAWDRTWPVLLIVLGTSLMFYSE